VLSARNHIIRSGLNTSLLRAPVSRQRLIITVRKKFVNFPQSRSFLKRPIRVNIKR
jgi:hypothetical protein